MSELVKEVLAGSYATVDALLKQQEERKPINVLLAQQEERQRNWPYGPPAWREKYMKAEQSEQPDGSGERAS